jgi:adenylate cyclase
MLAVLPFVDLSRDPEESSCDGLTKEVITQIAQLNAKRLGVIARTSAMSFKGTAKPIAQIGRELGVGYVLEGSVRHEGGRVRISAQVVEARDQHHVWADSYEEDLTDILRAQQRVAEAVTRAVRA